MKYHAEIVEFDNRVVTWETQEINGQVELTKIVAVNDFNTAENAESFKTLMNLVQNF